MMNLCFFNLLKVNTEMTKNGKHHLIKLKDRIANPGPNCLRSWVKDRITNPGPNCLHNWVKNKF